MDFEIKIPFNITGNGIANLEKLSTGLQTLSKNLAGVTSASVNVTVKPIGNYSGIINEWAKGAPKTPITPTPNASFKSVISDWSSGGASAKITVMVANKKLDIANQKISLQLDPKDIQQQLKTALSGQSFLPRRNQQPTDADALMRQSREYQRAYKQYQNELNQKINSKAPQSEQNDVRINWQQKEDALKHKYAEKAMKMDNAPTKTSYELNVTVNKASKQAMDALLKNNISNLKLQIGNLSVSSNALSSIHAQIMAEINKISAQVQNINVNVTNTNPPPTQQPPSPSGGGGGGGGGGRTRRAPEASSPREKDMFSAGETAIGKGIGGISNVWNELRDSIFKAQLAMFSANFLVQNPFSQKMIGMGRSAYQFGKESIGVTDDMRKMQLQLFGATRSQPTTDNLMRIAREIELTSVGTFKDIFGVVSSLAIQPSLKPTLQGGNQADIKKLIQTVQMLGILNPFGMEGAQYIMQEMMSGELYSVGRRLNVTPEMMLATAGSSRAQYNSAGALERAEILGKYTRKVMGEDTLEEFNKTFKNTMENTQGYIEVFKQQVGEGTLHPGEQKGLYRPVAPKGLYDSARDFFKDTINRDIFQRYQKTGEQIHIGSEVGESYDRVTGKRTSKESLSREEMLGTSMSTYGGAFMNAFDRGFKQIMWGNKEGVTPGGGLEGKFDKFLLGEWVPDKSGKGGRFEGGLFTDLNNIKNDGYYKNKEGLKFTGDTAYIVKLSDTFKDVSKGMQTFRASPISSIDSFVNSFKLPPEVKDLGKSAIEAIAEGFKTGLHTLGMLAPKAMELFLKGVVQSVGSLATGAMKGLPLMTSSFIPGSSMLGGMLAPAIPLMMAMKAGVGHGTLERGYPNIFDPNGGQGGSGREGSWKQYKGNAPLGMNLMGYGGWLNPYQFGPASGPTFMQRAGGLFSGSGFSSGAPGLTRGDFAWRGLGYGVANAALMAGTTGMSTTESLFGGGLVSFGGLGALNYGIKHPTGRISKALGVSNVGNIIEAEQRAGFNTTQQKMFSAIPLAGTMLLQGGIGALSGGGWKSLLAGLAQGGASMLMMNAIPVMQEMGAWRKMGNAGAIPGLITRRDDARIKAASSLATINAQQGTSYRSFAELNKSNTWNAVKDSAIYRYGNAAAVSAEQREGQLVRARYLQNTFGSYSAGSSKWQVGAQSLGMGLESALMIGPLLRTMAGGISSVAGNLATWSAGLAASSNAVAKWAGSLITPVAQGAASGAGQFAISGIGGLASRFLTKRNVVIGSAILIGSALGLWGKSKYDDNEEMKKADAGSDAVRKFNLNKGLKDLPVVIGAKDTYLQNAKKSDMFSEFSREKGIEDALKDVDEAYKSVQGKMGEGKLPEGAKLFFKSSETMKKGFDLQEEEQKKQAAVGKSTLEDFNKSLPAVADDLSRQAKPKKGMEGFASEVAKASQDARKKSGAVRGQDDEKLTGEMQLYQKDIEALLALAKQPGKEDEKIDKLKDIKTRAKKINEMVLSPEVKEVLDKNFGKALETAQSLNPEEKEKALTAIQTMGIDRMTMVRYQRADYNKQFNAPMAQSILKQGLTNVGEGTQSILDVGADMAKYVGQMDKGKAILDTKSREALKASGPNLETGVKGILKLDQVSESLKTQLKNEIGKLTDLGTDSATRIKFGEKLSEAIEKEIKLLEAKDLAIQAGGGTEQDKSEKTQEVNKQKAKLQTFKGQVDDAAAFSKEIDKANALQAQERRAILATAATGKADFGTSMGQAIPSVLLAGMDPSKILSQAMQAIGNTQGYVNSVKSNPNATINELITAGKVNQQNMETTQALQLAPYAQSQIRNKLSDQGTQMKYGEQDEFWGNRMAFAGAATQFAPQLQRQYAKMKLKEEEGNIGDILKGRDISQITDPGERRELANRLRAASLSAITTGRYSTGKKYENQAAELEWQNKEETKAKAREWADKFKGTEAEKKEAYNKYMQEENAKAGVVPGASDSDKFASIATYTQNTAENTKAALGKLDDIKSNIAKLSGGGIANSGGANTPSLAASIDNSIKEQKDSLALAKKEGRTKDVATIESNISELEKMKRVTGMPLSPYQKSLDTDIAGAKELKQKFSEAGNEDGVKLMDKQIAKLEEARRNSNPETKTAADKEHMATVGVKPIIRTGLENPAFNGVAEEPKKETKPEPKKEEPKKGFWGRMASIFGDSTSSASELPLSSGHLKDELSKEGKGIFSPQELSILPMQEKARRYMIAQNELKKKEDRKQFLIADKKNAMAYAYSPEGELLGKTSTLTGKNAGDILKMDLSGDASKATGDAVKGNAITPAGIFTAVKKSDIYGFPGYTLPETSEATGVNAFHAYYRKVKSERRKERLASADLMAKKISQGCINTDDAFAKVMGKMDKEVEAIILPEKELEGDFNKLFAKNSAETQTKSPVEVSPAEASLAIPDSSMHDAIFGLASTAATVGGIGFVYSKGKGLLNKYTQGKPKPKLSPAPSGPPKPPVEPPIVESAAVEPPKPTATVEPPKPTVATEGPFATANAGGKNTHPLQEIMKESIERGNFEGTAGELLEGGSNNIGVISPKEDTSKIIKLEAKRVHRGTKSNLADLEAIMGKSKGLPANVMGIEDIVSNDTRIASLSRRATGTTVGKMNAAELAKIPQEHFNGLIQDTLAIEKAGLLPDLANSENIKYDAKKGFQQFDLGLGSKYQTPYSQATLAPQMSQALLGGPANTAEEIAALAKTHGVEPSVIEDIVGKVNKGFEPNAPTQPVGIPETANRVVNKPIPEGKAALFSEVGKATEELRGRGSAKAEAAKAAKAAKDAAIKANAEQSAKLSNMLKTAEGVSPSGTEVKPVEAKPSTLFGKAKQGVEAASSKVPWKTAGKIAGGAAGLIFVGKDAYDARQRVKNAEPEDQGQVAADEAGDFLGMVSGMEYGATVGALAGSAILPGVGTVVGGLVGGAIGAFAGSSVGRTVVGGTYGAYKDYARPWEKGAAAMFGKKGDTITMSGDKPGETKTISRKDNPKEFYRTKKRIEMGNELTLGELANKARANGGKLSEGESLQYESFLNRAADADTLKYKAEAEAEAAVNGTAAPSDSDIKDYRDRRKAELQKEYSWTGKGDATAKIKAKILNEDDRYKKRAFQDNVNANMPTSHADYIDKKNSLGNYVGEDKEILQAAITQYEEAQQGPEINQLIKNRDAMKARATSERAKGNTAEADKFDKKAEEFQKKIDSTPNRLKEANENYAAGKQRDDIAGMYANPKVDEETALEFQYKAGMIGENAYNSIKKNLQEKKKKQATEGPKSGWQADKDVKERDWSSGASRDYFNENKPLPNSYYGGADWTKVPSQDLSKMKGVQRNFVTGEMRVAEVGEQETSWFNRGEEAKERAEKNKLLSGSGAKAGFVKGGSGTPQSSGGFSSGKEQKVSGNEQAYEGDNPDVFTNADLGESSANIKSKASAMFSKKLEKDFNAIDKEIEKIWGVSPDSTEASKMFGVKPGEPIKGTVDSGKSPIHSIEPTKAEAPTKSPEASTAVATGDITPISALFNAPKNMSGSTSNNNDFITPLVNAFTAKGAEATPPPDMSAMLGNATEGAGATPPPNINPEAMIEATATQAPTTAGIENNVPDGGVVGAISVSAQETRDTTQYSNAQIVAAVEKSTQTIDKHGTNQTAILTDNTDAVNKGNYIQAVTGN